MTVPLAIAVASAPIAAATHVLMFAVESLLFDRISTRRMLEVPERHAAAVRQWAYPQGVSNLLLGAMSAAGAIGLVLGSGIGGRTLLLASNAAMVVAALALIGADRRRERVPGALAQALPAAVCLIALGR